MKRMVLGALFLCFTLIFMSPFSVYGQDSPNYVTVKGGIYVPTGDLDELDQGFSGEVAYGHYFNPNLALEGSIGYFKTDGSESEFIGGPAGTVTVATDVSVIPIFVAIKGLLPIQIGELYVGGGVGIGFADVKIDVTSTALGIASLSSTDTVFGFELLAGANFNINDSWFLGVEGKYIITDEASISGALFGFPFAESGDATGIILSGVVGFRF